MRDSTETFKKASRSRQRQKKLGKNDAGTKRKKEEKNGILGLKKAKKKMS